MTSNMTKSNQQETPVLLTYQLGEHIMAFSTTRHGGVSQGSYGSFNINAYCGDAVEAIQQNRLLLCHCLGVDVSRLVLPHQVHGVRVEQITPAFFHKTTEERQAQLEGVDAVMTNVCDACLGVSTADCIPVLIYDPIHHAAAAIHAGWRGTVQRIVCYVVEAMVKAYGSKPETLRAVIGPGIGLDAFEVGDEVYDAFANAGFCMERMSRRDDKWHLDLWACNQQQLLACGLTTEHIQLSGICTYQQCDDYFSARRLGIRSGRVFTAFVLR